MGSKHLERLGGLAAGLGVINQHMLSARVRNVEPGAVKMNVADLGVPHVHDAPAVSDICPRPKFAETFAFDQELVDQSARPGIIYIGACDFAQPTHRDFSRLVPIDVELKGSRR